MGEDINTTRTIYNASKDMLYHRSGTQFEDIAMIVTNGRKYLIRKDYNHKSQAMPTKKIKELVIKNPKEVIVIHNHPNSSIPSYPDLVNAINYKYKYGLVISHDGTLYRYRPNYVRYLNESIYRARVADVDASGYNEKEMFQLIEALKYFGIDLEVFK